MPWRCDGSSYGKIAERLNAEGIKGKHGGAIYASTIHKIVGNDLHQVGLAYISVHCCAGFGFCVQ